MSSLVDRLVALELATAFCLGLQVFLLAISKLMDEVFERIAKDLGGGMESVLRSAVVISSCGPDLPHASVIIH